MKYNTDKEKIARIILIIIALLLIAGGVFRLARGWAERSAEERTVKVWILCKPGSRVIVRRTPEKNAQEVGSLEACDWFMTDAKSANGYIRAFGIGEYGEGWVYCGNVVTEEPVAVFERYCCVAKKRAALRRWVDGPQVAGSPWLVNGSTVEVFYTAEGWACTSRGYIKSEWLEVDPE